MSNEIAALKKKVRGLEQRLGRLEKGHGTIAVYLKATDPNLKKAILMLGEAAARVAKGAPHLTTEEQARIKKLLRIG
jgi:hypothetical protein